jgi:ADP-ribosylglycohydrolase
VEKIPRRGIREILDSTGRWPLSGYFTAQGLPEDVAGRWPWNRASRPTSLAEVIEGMPEDDDLNYALLALHVLERHGDALTTDDVARAWLDLLPGLRVFTAERIAYRNLLDGLQPPDTARRGNPYREWIGAQIRSDAYGWSHPGDPRTAARLAWLDARLSHTRNGLYGARFVAAMAAASLVTDDIEQVLDAGAGVVPEGSRMADTIAWARRTARETGDFEAAVDALEARYADLHWVHALNNTALVVLALTFGEGAFVPSICLVVQGGLDTDSNGATVGSILGGLCGRSGLPDSWATPLRNRLASSMPGFDGIGFDELAARTLALIPEDR